ncbi:enoyl-CoA hydratase/isomerase family protein [Pararoseomonas indoligenes]|uniref:Enoyl-CoA hydratase/isomerase family protein n=1 Tax=Roseomonas indoligenes TaxID=2820811 RepID=A0A940N157_9PROT|nr:enoyl-CoA hydratase/isomerase family protein [Pararoseomonas indoligenes]MBP0494867.1 enoyl-CoA hydratase/isomerase family protein [Pararoseomonas indoligenes]
MSDGREARAPSLSINGAVATIRLHRPAVHNRIEPGDLVALAEILDTIGADRAVRAVILTASGRSFSSGFHIGELKPGEGTDESSFGRLADRLEALRQPTICAMNGGVYGGSTDLALACDFRIGVTGMAMFMPAARLGLHYYPSGLGRYVSRLGLNAAKRLFLTAEKLEAEELLRIGFLTELVPPDVLEARASALAAALCANAPLAVQGMKAALNGIARGNMDAEAVAATIRQVRDSQDLQEGKAAWAEKRAPVFTGR